MSRKTPTPVPASNRGAFDAVRVALPLVGVTLMRRDDSGLPPDATGLERRLYHLLDSPRSPLSLCSVLPVPPTETAAALRRLLATRAIRAKPDRKGRYDG